jgi:hypothetical protein
MYLTAHRVVSPSGAQGVNAFYHTHSDGTFPPGELSTATISEVADERPGILERRETSVSPGGNSVRSYLDVVAADGTPPARIRDALDWFAGLLPVESLPYSRIYEDTVGIRLSMNIGLWPRMVDEYQVLRKALDRWL